MRSTPCRESHNCYFASAALLFSRFYCPRARAPKFASTTTIARLTENAARAAGCSMSAAKSLAIVTLTARQLCGHAQEALANLCPWAAAARAGPGFLSPEWDRHADPDGLVVESSKAWAANRGCNA